MDIDFAALPRRGREMWSSGMWTDMVSRGRPTEGSACGKYLPGRLKCRLLLGSVRAHR